MNIEEHIAELIPDNDEYTYGFANLTDLLADRYKKHNFCIVIGKKLNDDIINSINEGPTIEYFNHYNTVNVDLLLLAEKILKELEKYNISGIIIKPTITEEDIDNQFHITLRYDFSHKMAATRAGIGWIGKTDLLISEKFGPRLRLVSILVDYEFKNLNLPNNESRCGNCNLCVISCPAKAANGLAWNIKIDRDQFFDSHKCREKCLELSNKRLKKDISICGICVSACPIGKK